MAHTMMPSIEIFLAQKPSDKACTFLLKEFHNCEHVVNNSHRPPYYYWSSQLDTTVKQQIQKHLSLLKPSSLNNQIVYLGLMLRLGLNDELCLNNIRKTCDKAGDLPAIVLFELCNIFHAERAFKKLKIISAIGIQKTDKNSDALSIYCDWYVLAAYRILIPLFSENKLTQTHVDDLEEEINETIAKLGPYSKNSLFYKAVITSMKGNLENAVTLAKQAANTPGKMLEIFRKTEHFTDLPPVADFDINTHQDTQTHHLRHEATGQAVLLVSADKPYFDRYHKKLVESFSYWNKDSILHIHCVGFTPDEYSLDLLEATEGCRINYTVDNKPEYMQSNNLHKGYCAGARYLYLPYYIDLYSKLVIADIDGVIRGPLQSLWRGDKKAILLTTKLFNASWQTGRLMWETIAAGAFAIVDTPKNQQFSNALSTYLNERLLHAAKTGEDPFFTDQIGLVLCYIAFKNTCHFETCIGLYSQVGQGNVTSKEDTKLQYQNSVNYKKTPKQVERLKNG